MAKYAVGAELKCPCGNCNSKMWWGPDDVFNHLVCKGPSLDIVKWIYDVSNLGDADVRDCETNIGFEDDLNQMLNLTYTNREPNSDARKFYLLVEDGKQPLDPGSKKNSRLSFLVRLYHWKCLNGVTQTAFGEMLQLLKEAFPDVEIPTSFNSAKNNEVSCKTFGVSRWRDTEEEHKKDKIPTKVMRYFPLKPRLQRILGIDSDGFNPFGTMSGSHSTWPVVVVNYNLPPWLNMKPENLILSTLIPGPTDPGNSIDVYLQPLVEELKELWDVEVGQAPAVLSGSMIKRLLDGYQNTFGKVIEVDIVKKLQKEIIEILCRLEINFPPAFFDIMVHLPVHLCNEIELGGPVHQRWMYSIERMGGDFMTFNLHHKGEFHKNKYAGGTVNTVKDFELDVFSYSELMDDGWELITDDAALNECTFKSEASELDLFIDIDVDKNMSAMRQMQPHVIVRPKRSPVNPKEDNPKKRQFVTLKDINEEKTRKMNKSRKKTQSTDKVSKAVVIEMKSDQSDLIGMAEYMKRFEIPDTNKNLGKGAGEGSDGGNALNAYKMQRNKNVEENMKKIKELGIKPLTGKLIKKKDVRTNIQSDEDESEYRSLEKDLDRESNEEEHIVKPKGKKKAEKENDASEVPIVPIMEKLKKLKNRGPGTMERYLELREREKEAEMEAKLEAEMEGQIESLHDIFQSQQAQADAPAEKIKKPRGKSKMKHVHTRGKKREIVLSKLGQPISDDDRFLSEFSNFLGTIVRKFVSLTCRMWSEVSDKEILWQYVKDKYIISEEGYKYVMTTMRDQFKGYKASIKKDHYSKYDTDELRLQKRPREVPLKDFKILLNYWGDEKVQERARKNAEARNKITETHTVGPRSFAQVFHKMAIERERLAKPDEPIVPILDVDVYVKTRKRDVKREYKLPTDVVEKKIDVKKNLKDGNIDAANELVRAGKEHNRSNLVGKLIRKKESKGGDGRENGSECSRASRQYKVMMSKLEERNPELQIDIEELSKLQSPSEQPPSDATRTSKQPPSDATRASNSSP
ncbi:hypothetical protein AgCh_029216 [Apium graveolens]